MTSQEILKSSEDKMKKVLDLFQEELKTIRTGKANPDVFKRIRIECYGASMSLPEVAGVSAPDGRSFMIQPFDKSNLKAIETAIQNSDLGFSPSNDGSVIRINVPPLSNDRRNELVKQVSKMTEEKAKIPIRNIRRDAQDSLKKLKGTVSDDELKKDQDNLEKTTSKYIATVDELLSKKEQELKTI
jgi:ribosome recycling factor